MRFSSMFLLGLPLVWSLSIRQARAQSTTTPEARAAALAAQAMRHEGDAAAELPPLEVMFEAWGVPLRRPYAFDHANMIRVGIEQELPAPGERPSLRRAAHLRGQALLADGEARGRALALRKAHAVVDYHGALRSHRVHLAHWRLTERIVELARARHAAGSSLADVSAAEVEVARAAALVAADEERARTSRSLLEALRDVGSLKASRERPELVSLRLAREAEAAQAHAERARKNWPAPRVGVAYFAPSAGMAGHGYGISLGMRLPWLWGSRAGLEQAAVSRSRALSEELAVKQRDLAIETIAARGAVHAAQSAAKVLGERVLPASQRARQLAQAGYESGQARLDELLRAEAQQVDVEMELVELENELAHRNADLAFATGQALPAAAKEQEKSHEP